MPFTPPEEGRKYPPFIVALLPLIAVVVVFILRKVWKKRPKPAQTPPPAEYPVKSGDEPKPKY